MNSTITIIPFTKLALAFLPVLVVLVILHIWSLDYKRVIYGICRMLGQLLLIGYFLAYIFESDSGLVVMGVLTVMLLASSSIALSNMKDSQGSKWDLYRKALLSIVVGGALTLILISQGVLALDPWYLPRYLIPLAGMIFANSMNSVSLAAERFQAETARGETDKEARAIALRAALIPITNSLFAVGLVSLPGMMTGQILSGTSPLIAARYQIMVMCMIFGTAGISAALFLWLISDTHKQKNYSK